MTDPIAQEVLRLVAAQARRPVGEIGPEDSPASLGLDSLNLVELVFAIEEAFDIHVPFSAQDEGPQEFDTSTVGRVIEGVRGLVLAKAE